MTTIKLRVDKESKLWVAEIGKKTVPTPFFSSTPSRVVVDAVKRQNPGVKVQWTVSLQ